MCTVIHKGEQHIVECCAVGVTVWLIFLVALICLSPPPPAPPPADLAIPCPAGPPFDPHPPTHLPPSASCSWSLAGPQSQLFHAVQFFSERAAFSMVQQKICLPPWRHFKVLEAAYRKAIWYAHRCLLIPMMYFTPKGDGACCACVAGCLRCTPDLSCTSCTRHTHP